METTNLWQSYSEEQLKEVFAKRFIILGALAAEELIKKGYNKSIVHVDSMFGSSDMEIVGICHDGKVVKIFEKGNFVF